MRQEQDGGEGSTNNQAGRDINQYGLSVDQLVELKQHLDTTVVGEVELVVSRQIESIKNDFVKFTGEANTQAMATAQHLLTSFIEQLASRAPQNIRSVQTPSMQQSILNACTSAAVADDENLTQTLVDILIDKSDAEPRSFKGVVLNEALEVAGKLTADQVNLLSAIVMLRLTVSHGVSSDLDGVLQLLDSRCRPLYDKIPKSRSALQYMAYTGVGAFERTADMLMGQQSIRDHVRDTYDGIFTNGFALEALPADLELSHELPHVDPRIGDPDRFRFFLGSSQSIQFALQRGTKDEGLLNHGDAMRDLIVSNRCSMQRFNALLDADYSELSKFLTDLDHLGTLSFILSSVGIAVGQANWRRLLPDDAPDVDMFLA